MIKIEEYIPLIEAIEYLCDIEFYDIKMDSDDDLWLKIKSKSKDWRLVIVRTRLKDDVLTSAIDIIENWNLK